MTGKFNIPYRSEAIAVAMVLVFLLMVKNRLSDFKAQTVQFNTQTTAVENHKELSRRWTEAADKFDKSTKSFIFKDAYDFKKFVSRMAYDNDVNIDSLRQAQSRRGAVDEAKITMTVAAGYRQLVDYIRALEENNVRVESLSVGGADKIKQANLVVYCYYVQEG